MAEPATALAIAGATTSTMAVVAMTLGVPAPVVIAAVIGAAAAVMQAERTDLTPRTLITLLLTFALAVGLGIWGGRLAGHAVVGLLLGFIPHLGLEADAADALATVLLALLGQSKLLPLGLRLLENRVGVTK